MLPERFNQMTPDQRREHFAELRKRDLRTKPNPPPESAFQTKIKMQRIAKEFIHMPAKVTDKKSFNDLYLASASAAGKLEGIRQKYVAAAEGIKSQFDSMLAALPQKARDTIKPELDKKIAADLAELRAATDAERRQAIDSLLEAKKIADEVTPHLGNPVIQGSMFAAGSERKARLIAEMAEAGPGTVKAYAQQARMSGDLELASAVLHRNQLFEKQYRPVNQSEFAQTMFGPMTEEIANYGKGIDLQLQKALAAERDIQEKSTSPVQKVALGLAHPGEKIVPRADLLDEGSEGVTSLDKIQNGLAAA